MGQNAEDFYLGEISRGPVVWGVMRDPVSDEGKLLLYLTPLTTLKEVWSLVAFFGLWRLHVPRLSMWLILCCWATQKAAILEWDPEQEKVVREVQAAVWSSYLLGPVMLHLGHMVFEEPGAERVAVQSLLKALLGASKNRPWGFWSKALLSSTR